MSGDGGCYVATLSCHSLDVTALSSILVHPIVNICRWNCNLYFHWLLGPPLQHQEERKQDQYELLSQCTVQQRRDSSANALS